MANYVGWIIVFNCLMLCSVVYTQKQYRAGVYAHRVIQPNGTHSSVSRQKALDNMMKNIDIYNNVASEAKNQGVQILVFPDDGLYGNDFTRQGIEPYLEYIPDPTKDTWNPCTNPQKYNNNSDILWNLSCIAQANNIYMVVNMGNFQTCSKSSDPNCPTDGHYQFNTDVVFDHNGTLIARYHKTHLYNEDQFDAPAEPEHIYFDTPFGRFGLFTSLDMVYKTPAISLIEEYNITDVVYPAAWTDTPPLFSSIQFHSAFAMGMGINLLAANLQVPEDSIYGSGIYTANGYKTFYNDKSNQPKLLVADLNSNYIEDVHDREETEIHRKQNATSHSKHDSVKKTSSENDEHDTPSKTSGTFQGEIFNDTYTMKILENSGDVVTVCDNSLCCEFDYQMMEGSGKLVAFGAFDGLHTYLHRMYLQVCVVLECAGSSPQTCGIPTEESNLYFREFRLMGNFSTKYVFPEVLVSDSGRKTLASGALYDFHDGVLEVINGLRLPLISASLLSRDYARD
ncbi:VNN [Mytilus edulis]|uniref:VNN n=1 Tax=Mytilus edulis TaxID=6550 RepID=A0A8S3V8K5_MYTED|nr:VNN [Mytilus edulis]